MERNLLGLKKREIHGDKPRDVSLFDVCFSKATISALDEKAG